MVSGKPLNRRMAARGRRRQRGRDVVCGLVEIVVVPLHSHGAHPAGLVAVVVRVRRVRVGVVRRAHVAHEAAGRVPVRQMVRLEVKGVAAASIAAAGAADSHAAGGLVVGDVGAAAARDGV